MIAVLENVLFGLWAGISFLLVTFVPGLALSYWLFPSRDLDYLERLFIAIASSIAISSLISSILTWLPGGLQPSTFLAATGLLVAVFAGGYFYRSHRNRANGKSNEVVLPSIGLPQSKSELKDTLIWLLIATSIVVAVAAFSTPLPNSAAGITEFYFSPTFLNKLPTEKPIDAGSLLIPVEIANKEGHEMVYHLEVWAGERKVWERSKIAVENGQTIQETVFIALSKSNESPFLDLKLYSGLTTEPIAQLRLWLQTNAQQ